MAAALVAATAAPNVVLQSQNTSFDKTEMLYKLDQDYSVQSKPYILSNESNREECRKTLSAIPCSKGAFHIGFSCWENFDFINVRNSEGALIADISSTAHEFHLLTEKILLASKNREDFVTKMTAALHHDPKFLREDTGIDVKAIIAELHRNGGWLNSDASFSKIQNLYREKKIIHIRLDITNRAAFQVIAEWLTLNKLHCDSLYVCNIADWLKEAKDSVKLIGFMKMALNRVIHKDTCVIQASNQFPNTAGMAQRVFQFFPFDPLRGMTRN
jgi:hypothetical protein